MHLCGERLANGMEPRAFPPYALFRFDPPDASRAVRTSAMYFRTASRTSCESDTGAPR